jgi:hypothetical protein
LEWGGEVEGDDFVSLLGGAGVRKPRAERYGDSASRLVATQRELGDRQQFTEIAVARQQAVERTPDWADRALPAPEITRDLGRDLGVDLDMGW